jgi:chromosome segregation ATPase
MASEPSEEGQVTVSLPAELDDWLDDRAAALDVDRETVLIQLLASYRATAELDGDSPGEHPVPLTDAETIEEVVTSVLADRLGDHVESTVQTQVEAAVESAVADRLTEATDRVERQFDERIDAVEDDYMAKIEDVRERVIQLKKELDGKAAVDHDHDELDRVKELADQLDDIEQAVSDLESELESTASDHETQVEDVEDRLDTVQDRLKTVAWVVSDLREAQESSGGVEAVDRLKRAAAQMNVDKAKCESCEQIVNIGLLTESQCPHCQATVTNVEAASGFFGKPRLLTASQLESGERR